jgi:osmoprotectant transport system substrate-binding protein
MLRYLAAALLAGLALLVAACGERGEETGGSQPQGLDLNVTLGTKNFTEQFVLGELYKQVLRTQGYRVTLRRNIGSTEVVDRALQSGEIDGYPEYLGVADTVVAKKDVTGKNAAQTYRLAKDFYAGRGQALSEPSRFENVDAIATTVFYAQRHHITDVGDLGTVPGAFALGARPEFATRRQGVRGMRSVYGLRNIRFRPLAIGTQYSALDDGQVDAANVFTTDGRLASGQYKVLADPKRLFGFQHVALVIDKEKLKRLGGDRFMSIVDRLNRRLTIPAMIDMNRAVDVEGLDPETVATRFLQQNGLVPSND